MRRILGRLQKRGSKQRQNEKGIGPNEAARSLRVKQSGWVGLVLPDLASEEGPMVSGGLVEAAQESGIAVLVGIARTAKEEMEQVRAMIGRGAEASFYSPESVRSIGRPPWSL